MPRTMQEVECVFTVELTQIITVPQETVADYEQLCDYDRSHNEKELKRLLNADKVDITGYKCFPHDPKTEVDCNDEK